MQSRSALLVLAIAACGGEHASAPDAREAPADAIVDAAPDAPAVCVSYPLSSLPAAGAEAAATAELATLSPGANLTWNDDTGTLSTIFQLDVPLPDCVDGADLNATVIAVLRAHPALFQLDLDEWQVPPFYDCRFVTDQIDTQTLGRQELGGHLVAKDIFSYGFKRTAAGVVLSSVIATYVPPATAELAAHLDECDQLDASDAEAIARATDLGASVYDQCAPSGSIVYRAHADDTVTVVPGTTWSWDPTVGGVRLTATRTVGVTLAPANYTPALLASGARCPVADPDSNDFTVGWIVTLDARTGAVVNVSPGLGCIVC